jgi:hypothetical protein
MAQRLASSSADEQAAERLQRLQSLSASAGAWRRQWRHQHRVQRQQGMKARQLHF